MQCGFSAWFLSELYTTSRMNPVNDNTELSDCLPREFQISTRCGICMNTVSDPVSAGCCFQVACRPCMEKSMEWQEVDRVVEEDGSITSIYGHRCPFCAIIHSNLVGLINSDNILPWIAQVLDRMPTICRKPGCHQEVPLSETRCAGHDCSKACAYCNLVCTNHDAMLVHHLTCGDFPLNCRHCSMAVTRFSRILHESYFALI